MSRSRASAKAAGSRAEKQVADFLAEHVDDRIERRTLTGSKDRGDIGGVRTREGARVVVEVKDVSTMTLGTWVNEAEVERVNDEALIGVVAHKRRGKSDAGDWYVTLTLRDLVALLTGNRPD